MTKKLFSFSLCTIVLLAIIARAQNANVVGSWDITIESPQGTRNSLLIIKQDGDKLTGMMKSPRGERPLDSITVKGSDITLVMTVNAQGQDLVITYKGKVEKDKMSGDADFGGFATGSWSAVPHKEGAAAAAPATAPATTAPATTASAASADNISGVWNFNVETPAGTGTPVFTLKQEGEKVTGTYKGQLGEAAVTGTVKGSDVMLMIKVSPQGEEITVTYTGKVTGKDAMSGKATFGSLGEGSWTAKRK
ncbi:MAG: hypothetical protein V7641_1822 [Blastocatellia bacterium]